MNIHQLWTSLRNFGILEKLVKMIKIFNSITYCKVRYRGEISDQFETNSGLKQEDALSTFIFNLTLEKEVRDTEAAYEVELNEKNCQTGLCRRN